MNLPELFKNRMKEYLSHEYEEFMASFDNPNEKAFHLNTQRMSLDKFNSLCQNQDFLKFNNINTIEKIPNIENGYYYTGEKIGQSPLSHAGIIYSQDPAAMMPVGLFNQTFDNDSQIKILDLCSAPGGKASQLAIKYGEKATIVCNEINNSRNKILISNIERMGYTNILVTKKSPDELQNDYNSYFDLILVDAPCSGEGMFRKYPESINEWSLENIYICKQRQEEILNSAISMLKPAGYLIYSTCTYSKEEDEQMSDYIISKGLSPVNCNDIESLKCYPHKIKGEGQYLSYFQKSGTSANVIMNDMNSNLKELDSKTKQIIHEALDKTFDINALNMFKFNDNIVILPENYIKMPTHQITMAGILAGSIENKRFIPNHQLFHAYGDLFKSRFNISSEDPIIYKYLHGEEILAPDIQNGYGVLTYHNVPIGGFKASNGRLKNHYPKGLRNM